MTAFEPLLGAHRRLRERAFQALKWLLGALPLLLPALALLVAVWQTVPHVWSGAPDIIGALPPWLTVPLWVLSALVLWLSDPKVAARGIAGACVFCVALVVWGVLMYALTGEIGERLAAQAKPLRTFWLWVGLAGGGLLVLVGIAGPSTLAWRVYSNRWRLWRIVGLVVLAQLATLWYLTDRDPRWERPTAEDDTPAIGRVDVLLVVDRDDKRARRLIDEAGSESPEIANRPSDTARFDIAFGAATVDEGVVQQPTTQRLRFARALGALGEPTEGVDAEVEWRPGARRGVVYVASNAPQADQALASGDVPIFFVSGGPDEEAWRNLAARTGGHAIDSAAYPRQTLFGAIEAALTDTPLTVARALAYKFRPSLRFQERDTLRPVDVDGLLQPARKRRAARVCERGEPPCEEVRTPHSLLGAKDDYIDFEGDARKGFKGAVSGLRSRMYFNMRRQGRRLHIGYWWYFPVNVSPVQSARTCIPGLSVRELTCYDHEGDWEGVTVTLGLADQAPGPPLDPYLPAAYDAAAWRLSSVSYDAHGRSIRWPLPKLRGTPALEGSHPVVFVARGSHASYPLPCPKSCGQGMANRALPEGPFGGHDPWDMNVEGVGDDLTDPCERIDCLIAMPSLHRMLLDRVPVRRMEEPALWNDFSGRWGAAVCIPLGQVCSQSEGPPTPSLQKRYRAPWRSTAPTRAARLIFAKRLAATQRYGLP